MVALPPLTDPCQGVNNSRFLAAVANASQFLPRKDLEHSRFFVRASGLTRHPTSRVVIGKEVGSDVPRHTAKGAAVALDVVVADKHCGGAASLPCPSNVLAL